VNGNDDDKNAGPQIPIEQDSTVENDDADRNTGVDTDITTEMVPTEVEQDSTVEDDDADRTTGVNTDSTTDGADRTTGVATKEVTGMPNLENETTGVSTEEGNATGVQRERHRPSGGHRQRDEHWDHMSATRRNDIALLKWRR
jgi:hypothetical protein